MLLITNQDETNDNDKKEIEHLTKELNNLKLAHDKSRGSYRASKNS